MAVYSYQVIITFEVDTTVTLHGWLQTRRILLFLGLQMRAMQSERIYAPPDSLRRRMLSPTGTC